MAGAARPRTFGYKDLPSVLARDPLPRAFVLLGEEMELKEEATDEIVGTLARRAGDGLERYRLDCEGVSLSEISGSYLVGGLFATAKLVVLTRFEKAPVAARRTFLGEIASDDLHPSLTVVVQSSERNLPAGVDPTRLTLFVFWPMNQSFEVELWVRGRLKKLGVKCDPQLAPYLHRRYGNDLALIRQEIDKARLLAGKQPLSTEHFEQIGSAPASEELFGVLDALAQGRSREALRGLNGLWEQGEPPQKVLPLLMIQYRRLLHATALREARPDRFMEVIDLARRHRTMRNFWEKKNLEREIAGALKRAVEGSPFEEELGGLKPMAATGLAAQLLGASGPLVRTIFKELLRLDFKMKTSGADPEVALEMLAALPLARPPA
ncbi:MAG: hypothetical protein HY815_13610 [Candidatus Riflebacteria bacterium]|nr:hypothetical protein [Candidatus Riflebacteria bacterium]